MSKELRADNERLGAEVALLREMLTMIGEAGMPRPAPGQYATYTEQCGVRLAELTTLIRGLMRYAGSPVFPRVAFTTTETLRAITAGPLWYKAAEGAMPAPVITNSERNCDAVNPDGSGEHCHKSGAHKTHRDSNGDMWTSEPMAVAS